ncbi:MAG: phosphoribosylanthranilate isomerase [Acidimicrobiales bacterium]
MFVKICGITTEEDALLAVALGADAVGFVFAPSPRQVTPSLVADITKRLPREITTVGVFRNESAKRVVEIANGIGLLGVQLHGNEGIEESQWIARRVRTVIKAFPAGHPMIRDFPSYGADILLVDGPVPGSGRMFDWKILEGVADPSKLILSGGLNPENVTDAIRYVQPWGVDVSSGVESTRGKKDPQKLRSFITRAKRAATNYDPNTSTEAQGGRTARLYDYNSEAYPYDTSDAIGHATTSEEPPTGALYDWQEDR